MPDFELVVLCILNTSGSFADHHYAAVFSFDPGTGELMRGIIASSAASAMLHTSANREYLIVQQLGTSSPIVFALLP